MSPCQQYGELPAEETTKNKGSEELSMEDDGGSVFWWLWESFLGVSPEDIESSIDTAEASSSEALSETLDTARTQSLSESMVNTASSVNISHPDTRPQHRCVVS